MIKKREEVVESDKKGNILLRDTEKIKAPDEGDSDQQKNRNEELDNEGNPHGPEVDPDDFEKGFDQGRGDKLSTRRGGGGLGPGGDKGKG